MRKLLIPVLIALAGCTTTGADTVRLNGNKAFLTAQIALKSAQQSTLAICTSPARPVAACDKAIDLLTKGAQAEAAGFTAQQSGNSADLQTSITTLVALPAQLVALGILKAN